jgi:hypothetical protein
MKEIYKLQPEARKRDCSESMSCDITRGRSRFGSKIITNAELNSIKPWLDLLQVLQTGLANALPPHLRPGCAF